MDDTKFEKAIGLAPGHLGKMRKAVVEYPEKVREGLKAKGYPRLKYEDEIIKIMQTESSLVEIKPKDGH